MTTMTTTLTAVNPTVETVESFMHDFVGMTCTGVNEGVAMFLARRGVRTEDIAAALNAYDRHGKVTGCRLLSDADQRESDRLIRDICTLFFQGVKALPYLTTPPAPPTPGPAAVETDAEIDMAISEGRASFVPVTPEGKATAARLAKTWAAIDRHAAAVAEVREWKAANLAPVHPWDVESDPRDWPSDTDDFTWELTPQTCPECGSGSDGEPCVCDSREAGERGARAAASEAAPCPAPTEADDLEWPPADDIASYEADAESPAGDSYALAIPPLSGGSPEAAPIVYETRPDGGGWLVTRDGRTVFRFRFAAPARVEMTNRARGEAEAAGVPVVARFADGRGVTETRWTPEVARVARRLAEAHATRQAERGAVATGVAAYVFSGETAETLSKASILGHDA